MPIAFTFLLLAGACIGAAFLVAGMAFLELAIHIKQGPEPVLVETPEPKGGWVTYNYTIRY